MTQDYEKLGVFYLGRPYDIKTQKTEAAPLLYDSKDLLTHAVCVGMTGSGKTGLCLGLLEEAAIDGVPAIAIDPKGDLGNLMLTFPNLSAEEFSPWVNEEEARLAGLTTADYAQRQSELWKKGLAEWDQDAERVRRLRQAAEVVIYTPGSNAGFPVSILKSFSVPEAAVMEDSELLGDRIQGAVSSLLGLLDIEADPLQSREHILLSNILKHSWTQGKDTDLASLIQLIQKPPFSRIGVMEIESFYPSKERFELAMRLNNLLAAPGFEAWMEGEPLQIDSILYSPAGKPRIAIFSIAHLNDTERMFFVSLLLNQVLGWVRTQSGTTSLRALLYMDEIFGFFPPTANPPSKKPLLTLLKQARAFGLGMVLATQNPVDLDYKGLSNAGTWLIGRLQTDRDKARILDGLEGASASGNSDFDRPAMEQILSALGKRVFLLHNVHEKGPVLFQTRWTLSYLRGPLTRNQIRLLMAGRSPLATGKDNPPVADPGPGESAGRKIVSQASSSASTGEFSPRPILPEDIDQYFFPIRTATPEGARLIYFPKLLGLGSVYYEDAKSGLETTLQVADLLDIPAKISRPDWTNAESIAAEETEWQKESEEDALFAPLPAEAGKSRNFETWKKSFAEDLYRTQKLDLLKSPYLGQISRPGESERDFRLRLNQAMREERDLQKEKLEKKYAPKLAALEEKMRRAQQAIAKEQSDATQQKFQTAISIGSTLLGAFFGRKTFSSSNLGRAAGSIRGVSKTFKESQDIAKAEENLAALQQQVEELNQEFQEECQNLETRMDAGTESLETISLKPKKTNISVSAMALAWIPHWQEDQDRFTPAWP